MQTGACVLAMNAVIRMPFVLPLLFGESVPLSRPYVRCSMFFLEMHLDVAVLVSCPPLFCTPTVRGFDEDGARFGGLEGRITNHDPSVSMQVGTPLAYAAKEGQVKTVRSLVVALGFAVRDRSHHEKCFGWKPCLIYASGVPACLRAAETQRYPRPCASI